MFIEPGSNFPPAEWKYMYDKYDEYCAWYSGDIETILKYYSGNILDEYTEESRFWARIEKGERANVCHLPISGDISETSADLLFSESPLIGTVKNSKSAESINEFIDENGLNSILLESAELAAAMSGCFLKLDIQNELSKLPIVSMITPKQVFPTFWRNRLWEILFFRIVKEKSDSSSIWRLFENRRRENRDLIIEYKLMKGTCDKIGKEVPFDSIDETRNLNLDPIKLKNIDGLGCVYVPNKRPNKLIPGSPLGGNDWGSTISLMDSLDFAYTSWIRDIELGMGQVFIDEELLTREVDNALGQETVKLNKFSKFQRCFINLNLSKARMGNDNVKPIEHVQFDLRVEEHMKTCEYWVTQIVLNSGYSPQTFGLGTEGRAESGTALRIRERKSFLTREKKSRYWQLAIKQLLLQMQKMEIANTTKNYTPNPVTVELEDSIIVDSSEQSETIRNLDSARAVSTLTKVKMQHPDWTDEEIMKETDIILKENSIALTEPTFNNEV